MSAGLSVRRITLKVLDEFQKKEQTSNKNGGAENGGHENATHEFDGPICRA